MIMGQEEKRNGNKKEKRGRHKYRVKEKGQRNKQKAVKKDRQKDWKNIETPKRGQREIFNHGQTYRISKREA